MSPAVTRGARGRRIGIAGTLVLALVAGLLVWFATRSDGEVVRKTDLNDGGIWVTNSAQARFGRINQAARQLDAGVLSNGSPGSGLDIFQNGAAVVGYSRASNQITPIDPAGATLAESQSISLSRAEPATGNRVYTAAPVDLRGGTIAMIDPAKGQVHAQRVDTRTGITALDQLQTQAKPVATVGGNAAVAVGEDGTVYALSAAKGVLAVIHPITTGFAQPALTTLGFSSKSAQVTAVGSHWVVLDVASGRLYSDRLEKPAEVSAGRGDPGAPAYAALQQPGPDAPYVLIEDAAGLTSVPISPDAAGQTPGVRVGQERPDADVLLTAPVRLGECIHGAWATAAIVRYGRNCAGQGRTDTVDLGPGTVRTPRVDGVKLRVNRGLIVLNDLDTGDVWDVENDNVKIDNWDSVIPPPQTDDKNRRKDQNLVDDQVARTPPEARPDTMRVRPGRTSTLHVLDNDSDSAGSILSIAPSDVSMPTVDGVTAAPSADGQTIQVTLPEEPAGDRFSFEYTVNNGTGAKSGRATARVTVQVVGPEVNTPPKLRQGTARLARTSYPVVASGQVTVGVIADWRDGENDPLQIQPADQTVGVDAAGALTVRAGSRTGEQDVGYVVDDSHGGSAKGTATLTVLGDDDKVVAPHTQPDVIRGVVGKPVQLQPLGNDVPGADPTDPGARLRLATDVQGPGSLVVDTNTDTGVLTVTGQSAGTSTVTYAAQSGSGVAVGRVRVDMYVDPGQDLPPVATPDSAVLRGQLPALVDVLSNDYSPRSDVIVVQKVQTDAAWLRTSVVQGRYVRVQSTTPLAGHQERRGTVTYTIDDGTKSAVGQLTLVQRPPLGKSVRPTVVDDEAIVRAGDAVTIPVLDNDSMTEGIPLKLDPAGVKVVQGDGQAFASGSVVRYVPPASVSAPQTTTLEYTVHPEGLRARAATGRVTVTTTSLPDKVKNPNRPPTARSFTASVTAGDAISITVPTSGVDPDGDLTFVGGIVGQLGGAVDLEYGRVLGFGAATVRYEAYPRSAGTEVIHYQLRDRFGATSEGFIRVGVVQPGDPQPPVAVEDDVVAAPGRTVHVDPLANDLISDGDAVTFEDFGKLNEPDVLSDFTRQKDDTFKVVAPPEGPAKVMTYGITNGLFDPSRSTVTVRGQKDFNNPPIAVDDTAEPKQGETSVLVDVLANDRDLDGDRASLTVSKVVGDGAVIEQDKVRITLRPEARVVPYVIADADDATAMALIYVPAGNKGLPYVPTGKVIKMAPDSTVKLDLADYIVDPRGGAVSLTSPDTVSTSPKDHLQQHADSARQLTLTSLGSYAGPAALMLEVTNATGPDDSTGQTAYVTIPVQIGPDVPVLRCPAYEVQLVADGPPRSIDIPRLCHAWLPAGMDPGAASYEASWSQGIDRVDLTQQDAGGRAVVLAAKPAAKAGATGVVTVKARGAAESFPIRVRVTGAPPIATLRPARVEGLIAGTSETVDLAQYLDSPLGAPQCELVSAQVSSGTGLAVSTSGCRVTVTASDTARDDGRIDVRATDAPGRPSAVGQVTVTVRSRPDATSAPSAVADRVQGGSARVDWRPPGYDGGLPILQYEVRTKGGPTRTCTASPCTIEGLTNGQKYTFAVRSRNAVGWSDWSPESNVVEPDTKPQAVSVGDITEGDRKLTVRWTPPRNEGSEVLQYQVQYVNIGGHAGATGLRKVTAPGLSAVLTGLVNDDAYRIRVQARNKAGWGPYGPEVRAQSFGKPANVPAPKLSPRTPTVGADNAQVSVSWGAVDPNGPPVTRYDVYRRTGSGGQWTHIGSRSGGQSRVLSDTIPYNGQTVQYTVTATNGGPATSNRANYSSYKADGIPETPNLRSVTTPSANYSANATFSLGDSRSTGYSSVRWRTSSGRSGSWSYSAGMSGGRASSLGTSRQTMQVRACNTAGSCSPWSRSVSFHPYGPTKPVTNTASRISGSGGKYTVTFTWKTQENGRPISRVQVSGAVSKTLAGGATSVSVSAGYDESKSVTVVAESAAGKSKGVKITSARTPDKPPPPKPQVSSVYRVGDTGYVPGCSSGDCQYIGYELKNYTGNIVCTFDSSDGSYDTPDDGASGRHNPTNGRNTSGKFFGYPTGWVKVTCRGSNGSDSATRNPWGG
ncbi:MAG: fibronectin type III domain-containing protein [Intrasporangium sp.]|uniref:Ig-like domain-containing protein n=1 Tax=Intrasporangium sp. TaxID=1925024 RepID=UPI002647EEE4|nr:fibronectin type III domain-containing protein [Intrasporangium sp.]MDN5795269.1 fibronectin type III domain-containing protein [Intrasporangium sp.]